MSSERIYLNHMRSLKQNFSVPLLKNAKDPKFKITEDDIHALFYRVDDLYNLHSNIFDKLGVPSRTAACAFAHRHRIT